MAKIKINLSDVPKSISHTITLVFGNGDESDLKIDYIYRDGDELAEYADLQAAKTEIDKAEAEKAGEQTDKKVSMREARKARIKKDIESIFEVATGWELSDKFNEASLTKFENRYPGALLAIMNGYFVALQEVRIKN